MRRFKFPLYGRSPMSAQSQVEETDRCVVRDLFLCIAAQLRGELVHHLFEFFALARLEDLHNSGMPSGTKIVELILQALVVVAKIFQHHGDLIRLFRGEIQLGLKVLKDSLTAGFPGRSCRGRTVKPLMQSIAHAQHPGCGAGQKHQ